MSKDYIFEFYGTKADLLFLINSRFNSSYGQYYCDDYIIENVDGEIRFGVERAGHSGGYWYIPTITERGGKTELCGTIRYIGPEDNRKKLQKVVDNIGFALMFILILPIVLIIQVYSFIKLIIRKIRKLPRLKTTEDKLFYLMETHLSCTRK